MTEEYEEYDEFGFDFLGRTKEEAEKEKAEYAARREEIKNDPIQRRLREIYVCTWYGIMDGTLEQNSPPKNIRPEDTEEKLYQDAVRVVESTKPSTAGLINGRTFWITPSGKTLWNIVSFGIGNRAEIDDYIQYNLGPYEQSKAIVLVGGEARWRHLVAALILGRKNKKVWVQPQNSKKEAFLRRLEKGIESGSKLVMDLDCHGSGDSLTGVFDTRWERRYD